jgi:peroxiredoxin
MAVESQMVPLGTPAPDFALTSVAGQKVSLADYQDEPALLVAFLCNHCPYVQHIEAVLGDVLRTQLPELAVVGVCSNDTTSHPDDDAAHLREQSQRAGWAFPYLVDEDQSVAREYGAGCTPDFFLFDAEKKLAYRGAFDASTPGNDEPVTGELLVSAARRVLAGQRVPEPHRASMGCSIKWKR